MTNAPALNGGEGFWIVLFSEDTTFEQNVPAVLLLIVASKGFLFQRNNTIHIKRGSSI